MCFGSRKDADGGGARSRDIDKQLRQDEKRLSKEVKLLLLGTFLCSQLEYALLTTEQELESRENPPF